MVNDLLFSNVFFHDVVESCGEMILATVATFCLTEHASLCLV